MEPGQKVMQIVHEDNKEQIYYGIVIRSAESKAGVRVQWHKGYSTWEKICNLIEVE